jgi:Holliday junction resolvase
LNKNYNNGVRRERRIIKKLEKEGWFYIRSAGSHSPIDIIAIKSGQFRFIQSKKTGYLSPKERAEKEELEQKLGINIEVM